MMLDNDGYVTSCDWCGKVTDCSHAPSCPISGDDWWMPGKRCLCGADKIILENQGPRETYWPDLFRTPEGRPIGSRFNGGLPPDFPRDTCRECSIELTPIVHRFAEISHINYLNSKLGKAINERRKENR